MKSRAYCVTCYILDVEFWKKFYTENKCDYMIFGKEICPTSGREHLQGYVHFKNAVSAESFRKKVEPRHVEIAGGNSLQNYNYCSKENNLAIELGTRPEQGKRSDMIELSTMITDKKSSKEIFEAQPGNFIRYHKGIEKAKELYVEKRNWKMDVRIYWGAPGTGKTKAVHEEFGDSLYVKMPGKWWDHYDGENCVVIDDFDPTNCFDIVYDFYLKLLDRYPMLIEVKGGSTQFRSKVVIFTSNFNPNTWFKERKNKEAFNRRVTEIRPFGVGTEVAGTEVSGVILDPDTDFKVWHDEVFEETL